MREISFRIIHKGTVYYWGFIQSGFKGIPVNNFGLDMETAKKLSRQYTGLQDSKNNRIYEGDKIKFFDDSGMPQKGFVEYSAISCAYYGRAIGGDDEGNQDIQLHKDHEIEVIGTIHDKK